MSNTQHTQGPVEISKGVFAGSYVNSVAKPDKVICQMFGNSTPEGMEMARSGETAANANLIVEAFNVATETGLTPRQLADHRAELLDVLGTLNRVCLDMGRAIRRLDEAGDFSSLWTQDGDYIAEGDYVTERARSAIAKARGAK